MPELEIQAGDRSRSGEVEAEVRVWKRMLSPGMLVAAVMGLSSGLPLLLSTTLMQARVRDAGVSLGDIGLMSLVGLPYTVKFLWAPVFDRFTLPFLGRRKGWLLLVQLLLALASVGMGLADPSRGEIGLTLFVVFACLVTFFSASQDIIVDAYRREDLSDRELGLGSSYYVYGYRLGMLITGGGGMILAEDLDWSLVYLLLALALVPGMLVTILCREPRSTTTAKDLKASVFEPFLDYFRRDGAVWILVFILLYKLGDSMATALSTPFFLDSGYSKAEIGTVVKLAGFWATLLGAFLGGAVILRTGINRGLWIFGGLQMVSTGGFAVLALAETNITWLALVVGLENLTSGMGTAAFLGFMARITNRRFTATQYALLSSLMGIPRVFISSGTGYLVEAFGWFWFFCLCTLAALPGLALLPRFAPWSGEGS